MSSSAGGWARATSERYMQGYEAQVNLRWTPHNLASLGALRAQIPALRSSVCNRLRALRARESPRYDRCVCSFDRLRAHRATLGACAHNLLFTIGACAHSSVRFAVTTPPPTLLLDENLGSGVDGQTAIDGQTRRERQCRERDFQVVLLGCRLQGAGCAPWFQVKM